MDLCRNIIDQLSGDSVRKLSSLVDADEESTSDAVRAAVPALLAGLGSMASRDDGAKKLTNALNQLGAGGIDDFSSMLGGDANALANKGTNLLSGLFGDNLLASVIGSLTKYASLSSGTIKKLLAFLAPMVLGKVGALWKTRGGTPQALAGMFAEQRENIADCMPAGLSLSDIPGWSASKSTAYSDPAPPRREVAYHEPVKKSAAAWAVPLALGLLGAFLVWSLFRNRAADDATADRPSDAAREVTTMKPVTPTLEAATVTGELRDLYASAERVMASITDPASAEAARPQLEELSAKIDAARKMIEQLPQAGRAAVQTVADEQLAVFKRQAEATLETPSLGSDMRDLIRQILQKLTELFLPATR